MQIFFSPTHTFDYVRVSHTVYEHLICIWILYRAALLKVYEKSYDFQSKLQQGMEILFHIVTIFYVTAMTIQRHTCGLLQRNMTTAVVSFITEKEWLAITLSFFHFILFVCHTINILKYAWHGDFYELISIHYLRFLVALYYNFSVAVCIWLDLCNLCQLEEKILGVKLVGWD